MVPRAARTTKQVMEDSRTKVADWMFAPYVGDVWTVETTTTVTPVSNEYVVVPALSQPWRCEYCGTTHKGIEHSPCRNCGAPTRVSVYGAQR